MKTCIVSSCGGHLTEVRALRSTYGKHEHVYVLNDRALLPKDMEGRTHFIRHSERDLLFFLNLAEAWRLLRRERPSVILSTGAGPVVPFALVGKMLRVPTIFVESFTRVERPSLTGRLMYPLADRFFYQWSALARFFPKAAWCGPLIDPRGGVDAAAAARPRTGPGSVFVTVGNPTQGFPRLLQEIDRLAGENVFGGRTVLLQTGNTTGFTARHCQQVAFLPMDRFVEQVRDADLVVAHAGAGTLIHVLEAGKIPIVAPRLSRYGEHVDDHQVELAETLQARGWAVPVLDVSGLRAAVETSLGAAGPPRLPDPAPELARVHEAILELGGARG